MKEEISIEKKEDKIEIEIEEKEGMEIELEGNEKIKEIINEKYDDTEIKKEIEKLKEENEIIKTQIPKRRSKRRKDRNRRQ